MHEENEREEYSGEMIAGEGTREPKEPKEARESKKSKGQKREPMDLDAEVDRIFQKDTPMPIPVQKNKALPRKPNKRRDAVERTEAPKERERVPSHEEERKMPKRRRGSARYVLAMLLLLAVSVGVSLWTVRLAEQYAKDQTPTDEPSGSTPTGDEKIVFVHRYDDASGVLAVPELYEKYSDGVVSIRTVGTVGSGVGSGFFVREDGYVATVAHVVEGAKEITVITADGAQYRAQTVCANERTDLALLKIEGKGFHALSFGASGKLMVGERVIAIGTPASTDYAGTLCTGEISYRLRTLRIYDTSGRVLQKKMKLLQTNAPLNAGNSGCPLFDEYGRVVGIVTMKLGEGYEGIGFAIPSDGASAILGAMMRGEVLSEELLSTVSVGAAELGILGEESSVDGIAGVRIVRFSSNTCDAAIKLREGDLIIQLDGTPIATLGALSAIVQEKAAGDAVLVTVLRSGQRLSFEVILEKIIQ